MLDVLDELKIALLSGHLPPDMQAAARRGTVGQATAERRPAASTGSWMRSNCGPRSNSPNWTDRLALDGADMGILVANAAHNAAVIRIQTAICAALLARCQQIGTHITRH